MSIFVWLSSLCVPSLTVVLSSMAPYRLSSLRTVPDDGSWIHIPGMQKPSGSLVPRYLFWGWDCSSYYLLVNWINCLMVFNFVMVRKLSTLSHVFWQSLCSTRTWVPGLTSDFYVCYAWFRVAADNILHFDVVADWRDCKYWSETCIHTRLACWL